MRDKGILGLLVAALLLCGGTAARAFCFEEAGAEYNVPPGLLWAIAKVESGFDPLAFQRNANGSTDFGVMQINSSWIGRWPDVSLETLRDPCSNVRIGARVLADCLERHGYTWEGIGCYNALSIDKRAAYARRVIAVIERMQP
ncbi:lytic transglycosylase domain-containing protein [Geoalkalibacter sp.]|uniref:lytic transglycosylase domain-containing protein n=1 Tax=Geoalkalibacter sp. TaxID=3041440 RepID=UPI00272E0564|nr:lytic transglycosylase domain-containing protein [Geoalkalibacter sp.]